MISRYFNLPIAKQAADAFDEQALVANLRLSRGQPSPGNNATFLTARPPYQP
jgi:hypothetical protein